MKTTLLTTFLFISIQTSALQIHSATISAVSANAINVSLNTEAVELYYFNSWQYAISGSTITLEASFVYGFGSTIAYLNNNFQIPLNTIIPATYHLTVKVYYGNSGMLYHPQRLQDTLSVKFKTPLREKIIFKKPTAKTTDNPIFFPNPTDGPVQISQSVFVLGVYDITGKVVRKLNYNTRNVSLDSLNDGIYYIRYYFNKRYQCVIIKKI